MTCCRHTELSSDGESTLKASELIHHRQTCGDSQQETRSCSSQNNILLRTCSVHLSSGWPGCWRSGTPPPYRTRPPLWSTRSTAPGGKLHRRPSLPATGREPRLQVFLFSGPASSSCLPASSPAECCIAAPRPSSPCSSRRTWLDTVSGTSRAWVDTTKKYACR